MIAPPEIPWRTAQRWLATLVRSGRIHAIGKGPARRYLAAGRSEAVAGRAADVFRSIPVSAASKDILAYVEQPLEARKPAGYQVPADFSGCA
jgi:hypothetical protein